MKQRRGALGLCLFCSMQVSAQTDDIDEVVVTGSFVHRSSDDISTPLHLIDAQSVKTDAMSSLGEAVDDVLGVSSSDYGAAVGQPIVRGLGGPRLKVLNNGMVINDAAAGGPDHQNDTDFLNLKQIEIIKGPSSLLYAQGTIGGILNIVDDTIAKQDVERTTYAVSGEYQSVNDGISGELAYKGRVAGFNLSLAYAESDFGFYDIPSGALSLEDEHHDEDEHGAGQGFLDNSDFANKARKIGLSKVEDWGYIGFSYSGSDNVFGIPFHGEESLGERIFSTTDSDNLTLEGVLKFGYQVINNIEYFVRRSEYSLTEQHQEDGHEDGHGPTIFSSDATEGGLRVDFSNARFKQKAVFNFINGESGQNGADAFMSIVESDELSFGYFLGKDFTAMHFDLGLRHDRIRRDSDHHSFDDAVTSVSFAMGSEFTDHFSASAGLSSVARLPSAVELFADGVHLARQRFEEGNVDLVSERSTNLDITLKFNRENFFSTLSLFKNRIDDFIYLRDEDEHEEELQDHDGHGYVDLIHAGYWQQDAEFTGYEVELGRSFKLEKGRLTMSIGRDDVRSEFVAGGYIPRSVPARSLVRLTYQNDDDFRASLSYKRVYEQNRIAENEIATESYNMLNIRASKVFHSKETRQLTVSLFGKNLLDEIARNHTSFVKEYVPLPGRNMGLKVNYLF